MNLKLVCNLVLVPLPKEAACFKSRLARITHPYKNIISLPSVFWYKNILDFLLRFMIKKRVDTFFYYY
jgi:hypothetical protein